MYSTFAAVAVSVCKQLPDEHAVTKQFSITKAVIA
jgi:hypothetical protein